MIVSTGRVSGSRFSKGGMSPVNEPLREQEGHMTTGPKTQYM
jgi:hypothetical protein